MRTFGANSFRKRAAEDERLHKKKNNYRLILDILKDILANEEEDVGWRSKMQDTEIRSTRRS